MTTSNSQNDSYAQGHWQAALDWHLGSRTADPSQAATGGTTHDAVLSNQNGQMFLNAKIKVNLKPSSIKAEWLLRAPMRLRCVLG